MSDASIAREVELLVRSIAERLTTPAEEECLLCFVVRMLEQFGCDDTLRFAARYRDQRAPRATALERRLGSVGGYCDCEILLNGYEVADEQQRPPCQGVRRGSTQPCVNWRRQQHGRW